MNFFKKIFSLKQTEEKNEKVIDVEKNIEDDTINVSESYRRCLNLFVYYYNNMSLNFVISGNILDGLDYIKEIDNRPGTLQIIFAVYMNNIKMDKHGEVLNFKYAMTRAAHYIRIACDNGYKPEPDLENWELELFL